MTEPVKLDPIFGTMFGDHATDCRCDTCVRLEREKAEWLAKYEAMRAQLDELADHAEAEAETVHHCPDCGGRCLCSGYEYDSNCTHQCPPEKDSP